VAVPLKGILAVWTPNFHRVNLAKLYCLRYLNAYSACGLYNVISAVFSKMNDFSRSQTKLCTF